jgi:ParB/RepB/Spo0J family partition protein
MKCHPLVAGTRRIRFADIVVDPEENARKEYDTSSRNPDRQTEKMTALVESIKRNGLQSNLSVLDSDHPPYRLVAGYRRYDAIRAIMNEKGYRGGFDEVDVTVIRGGASPEEISFYSLDENLKRKNLSSPELADYCCTLSTRYKLDGAQIAARVGLSKGHVNNLISASRNLIPEIASAWREREPPLSTMLVFELCHRSKEEQQQWAAQNLGGEKKEGEEKPERGKSGRPSSRRIREVVKVLDRLIADSPSPEATAHPHMRMALLWVLGSISEIPGVPESSPKADKAIKEE